MKDFADCERKRQLVRKAYNLIDIYRSIYAESKLIQEVHRSNDPILKSAIDSLFTKDEWKVLKRMSEKIDALITDWEKNYKDVLN